MKKKVLSVVLAALLCTGLTACGTTGTENKTEDVQSTQSGNQETGTEKTIAGDKKTLIFSTFSNPDEVLNEMFETNYPEYRIETVQNDTATIDQTIKTSIAAGDPPEVVGYWGTRLSSFSDIGMCRDLRGFVDQELLDKLPKELLSIMSGPDGEIWGVPIDLSFHVVFYNKTMMDSYGFNEPETWQELTNLFAKLKEDDIYGFSSNSASMQDTIYGMTYAELESKMGKGTSRELVLGNVNVSPGSEAGEIIGNVIDQVKQWYDAGYWYPGKSAVNITADDANAAFAQGKCAFIFANNGAYNNFKDSSDFEIGVFMKPVSEKGLVSYENTEPGCLFIPEGVSDEDAVIAGKFIEQALSEEYQASRVQNGNLALFTPENLENVDPILVELMSFIEEGYLICGINPTAVSPEMQSFVKKEIFASPLTGTRTLDETLEEMQRIIDAGKSGS